MNGIKTLEKYFEAKEREKIIGDDKRAFIKWVHSIDVQENDCNIDSITISFHKPLHPLTKAYIAKAIRENQEKILEMAWNTAYKEYLEAKEEAKRIIKSILAD
jgi:hypothetical protein